MNRKNQKSRRKPSVPKTRVEQRLLEVKLQRDELELKLMQAQVNNMQSAEAAGRLSSEQQERNNRLREESDRQIQDNCSHRKGGSNIDGFYTGGADMYAVVKHTYPVPYIPGFETCTGTTVHCQRCHKEWTRASDEYEEALRFPTNNQSSGTALFSVTLHQRAA